MRKAVKMMVIFKCDRCKKPFEEHTIRWSKESKYALDKIVVTCEHTSSNNNYFDICPKCFKSFIKWFKKGGVNIDEL